MSEPAETDGGTGGPYQIPLKSITDIRMEQRAIRERWPIKEEYRQPLLDRQVRIALDPESPAKEATAAFRAILAADDQNMEQERRDQKGSDYHEVVDVVTEEQKRAAVAELRELLAEFPEAHQRISESVYQRLQERRARETNGRQH